MLLLYILLYCSDEPMSTSASSEKANNIVTEIKTAEDQANSPDEALYNNSSSSSYKETSSVKTKSFFNKDQSSSGNSKCQF